MFGLVAMYCANAAAAFAFGACLDTSHRPPPRSPVTFAPLVAVGAGCATIVPLGTPPVAPVWNTAVPSHSAPTAITIFVGPPGTEKMLESVRDLPTSPDASIAFAIPVQLGEFGLISIVPFPVTWSSGH